MKNNFRTVLMTTAVVGALAVASSLYAATGDETAKGAGGMADGMMQGGQSDMAGMMNMMGQMSQMMESCNNMMQGMSQHRGSEKPEQKPGQPEQKR